MQTAKSSLIDELAQSLPAGLELKYYHISVPPTRCVDIYSPPPGQEPLKTYSESHCLTVTIKPCNSDGEGHVAVFALELILYTTSRLSTLFVSKADSTGFASLLQLPYGSEPILRTIATTFISWLIRKRHRPDRRLVLSLFARAQGQYLFPGSVDNKDKHVLDDRGLVKWWCKTLDPIVREYVPEGSNGASAVESRQIESMAYLVVPGHDKHEIAAFFPPTASKDPANRKRWISGHPLYQISSHAHAPPRCLVPHFPDDPKARFLDDLDEELSDFKSSSQSQKLESPSKRGVGNWKSVKSLEQFWDMMAFRQECASGRLVGFIWIVFTPPDLENSTPHMDISEPPSPSQPRTGNNSIASTAKRPRISHVSNQLKGAIIPRAPRVKNRIQSGKEAHVQAESSMAFYSPANTRGTLVLDQKAYDRVHEVLLRLDFTGLNMAQASTAKWIQETAVIACAQKRDWGTKVIGIKPNQLKETAIANNGINFINILSVKKRKRINATETSTETGPAAALAQSSPNRVDGGPPRTDAAVPQTESLVPTGVTIDAGPQVNVLGGNLIRRKGKSAG